MKIQFKVIFSIFKSAFKEWVSKDPFRESAVIAYYSIFSLPGLLVVIITLAGLFFGRDAVSNHVILQIGNTLGADTALEIKEMVIKASKTESSIWAAIIGMITILVGATGVFAQFQKSLNIIWEVKAVESKSGIWTLIKVRLFSFGLIVSIAFILIVSLIISAALTAFGHWLSIHFSDTFVIVLLVVNFILSIAVLMVLFALMFKIFPDAKIQWRHVWIGSLVTAFLFEIGKFCLGLYFGTANPGSGYGAAGSVVLVLLWVSYSSMIVFYGAEFTRAYADYVTGKVPPNEVAVKDPGRES